MGHVHDRCRNFGESLIRYYPVRDDTNVKDRRFVEWLMDADQHSDEILKLPDRWWSLASSIKRHLHTHQVGGFCHKCNRTYAYKEMISQNDSGRESGSNFDRLFCPHAHLLLKVETIHICRSLGKFNLKEAMERSDRLKLPGLLEEYR